MRILLLAALVNLSLLGAVAAQADEPKPAPAAAPVQRPLTVADFMKDDSFVGVSISPTGEYVARSVNITDGNGTKRVLVVQQLKDGKITGHFNLGSTGKTEVEGFWWVNDHRLLISAGEKDGLLDEPQPNGEIYAMNADGSGQGMLIGARAHGLTDGESGGSHITTGKATVANSAYLVDDLPADPKYVIVKVWPQGSGPSSFPTVARMDVSTGATSTLGTAPVRNADFLTDLQGVVRFAMGANEDTKSKTYYRENDRAPWVLINDEAVSGLIVSPMGFSADNRTAYLAREDKGSGTDTLVAFDPATRAMKDVLHDAVSDPSGVYGPNREMIGVRYFDAKPRTVFFDEESPLAKAFRGLEASFPDQAVAIHGYANNGKVALVATYSDRSPGDYYLFDLEAKKATHLLSHRDWIDPDHMGEQRPIELKARDGLVLHGFLTVPAGSSGKNLPLVVNPHGGPFGIRDTWGFRGETQLLASRGYAVLQLNYRGSGGFGRAFETSGYKQWGGTMQDDLTDATKWAIQQGIADPKRICIYGASYGAYAALMGVAKEPGLYRCAAGYVGVYDLPTRYKDDVADRHSGKNFLKQTLGEENLEAVSPNKLAARITVPVLLAAGKEDHTAPPIHTEMMRDALLKAGKPVETTIYAGEGHGFYKEEDRESFYNSLLNFLDRNIGPGAAR